MSRRLQANTERASVITYVRGAVRPTYATDLDRYAQLKVVEKDVVEHWTEDFRGAGREHFAHAISLMTKHLVASSTKVTEIQLQLDGATRALYHPDKNQTFLTAYFPTNDNAPLCLIPHKTLPIVLQGYIERHEDGHFPNDDNIDLTYEQFQSNYFSMRAFDKHWWYNQDNRAKLSVARSNCRYRINVNYVHYRGKPVSSDAYRDDDTTRDFETKRLIYAMKSEEEKMAQESAYKTGYTEAQIRNIRTVFNNGNLDPDDKDFYEWHVASPDRLPLFLELPPLARENAELKMFGELGIQFPTAATGVFYTDSAFFIGFNAEDFTAGDSNVFFAESIRPSGRTVQMPIRLINSLPHYDFEPEFEFEPDLDPGRKQDEFDFDPAELEQDTDPKQELERFKHMVKQQNKIIKQHLEDSPETKRAFRRDWLATHKRQPTASEMAINNIIVRAALFPARFSNRVNYFDPESRNDGKTTDMQRSDLLLDFVCFYRPSL